MNEPSSVTTSVKGRRWLPPLIVLVLALFALVPTTGDIGLTWDEPSYRHSQLMSEQWWGRLIHARTPAELSQLFDPSSLLYYWPYGRYGINFHPPLAGQLNLLTYEIFGGWMKDIPARRMASVLEYALTLMILYQFLSRRYGAWVGGVAAAALLVMPRLYGDAHIAATDTPGLLLWAATAVAFWKGLHEPNSRWWRVGVGLLLGLAFVEKMAAVMVAGPLLLWLICGPLLAQLRRKNSRAAWIDGIVTTTAMSLPLGLAYREIVRLSEAFLQLQREIGIAPANLSVSRVNLFTQHPVAEFGGWILMVPLGVWLVRRLLSRVLPRSPIWGVDRPALEIWTAMLAFGPVVSWLGNPAWWRETLPRLAHYYALNAGRRGALPDIQILYFGQTYEYSLPWHNAWVLIAITVPVGILVASIVGLLLRLPTIRRDRVPLYFLLHLAILPVLRMMPTPAHDGVRLFLPTFFFLAAFAGWGVVGLADLIGRSPRARLVARLALSMLVLVPATWALARIHPFELSYYNELIGGPRGAWAKGFELSYWYDAFNDETLADLNRVLPDGTVIDTLSELSNPPTFTCLQNLGVIKGSLMLGTFEAKKFPSAWILKPKSGRPELMRADFAIWIVTQDSKATALTRLAFVMTPLYERRPWQLDGLRVVTVGSHEAAARAWALQFLTDAPPDLGRPDPPASPAWLRSLMPPLARFWGDDVTKVRPLRVNESMLAWARNDPSSLRAAARVLVEKWPNETDAAAERLRDLITHRSHPETVARFSTLMNMDRKMLLDAVEILIARPDDVRKVLTRYSYTDPSSIGGPLDRGLSFERK